MNARLLAVTRREYVSIVTRKSFWAGTLLIPLLIVVLGGISALSAESAKKSEKEEMGKSKHIEVDDPSHLISDRFIAAPIERTSDREAALAEVKAGRIDALIVYPAVLSVSSSIEIHEKETWITKRDRFEPMAKSLLKDSILDRVGDPNLIAVYNAKLPVETISYKDGQPAKDISALIVPASFIALFYMLLIMSSNTLLTSMTEEKENRVIEMLLTSIRPRELLFCKLVGLGAVGITQLVLTVGLALGAGAAFHTKLPFNIDFAKIVLDPVAIGLGFFYTISGYMLYAAIMAGVGASVPTAREAGGLVAFFLMCALSPFYFFMALVAEPTGATATLTSYFPLTAPLVLVLRNALGALSPLEMALSVLSMCAYVALAFGASVKIFELGALEYGQRLSFKRLFAKS